MPGVLIEEHRKYGMDCANAVWASDEMHGVYHSCGLSILCDTDFVVETEEYILLVEYKNANIPEAVKHATKGSKYDPCKEEKFNKIARKYYDSLHYLRLVGKTKPIQYIFVLDYPGGNSVSRKLLRERLKTQLPFKLEERFNNGIINPIKEVAVVNLDEWNAHELYGRFPFRPIDSLGLPQNF